jgi:hypothetical protein
VKRKTILTAQASKYFLDKYNYLSYKEKYALELHGQNTEAEGFEPSIGVSPPTFAYKANPINHSGKPPVIF